MKNIRELRVRFSVDDQRPNESIALQALGIAWGVVAANEAYFRFHPDAPCCLGCAGVRYVPPETCGPHCQWCDTAGVVLERRVATCLSAAAYACAKLRIKGEAATLWMAPMAEGDGGIIPGQFHMVVRLPNGTLVDPTEKLKRDPGTCQGVCSA